MTRSNDDRREADREPVEMWIEIDPPGGELTAHVGGEPDDQYAPPPPSESERCWRCDAREATTDVGLCQPCHTSLTAS